MSLLLKAPFLKKEASQTRRRPMDLTFAFASSEGGRQATSRDLSTAAGGG